MELSLRSGSRKKKSRERERENKLLDFARQKKIEAKKIERPSASSRSDGAERVHPANYLQTAERRLEEEERGLHANAAPPVNVTASGK